MRDLDFRGHPHARIANLQNHMRRGRRVGPLGQDGTVGRLHESPDDKAAALGHGVPGVQGQVHDDLVHLSRVGLDGREVRIQLGPEGDILADEAGQHLFQFGNVLVQVQDFRQKDLLTAVGQQLLGQLGGPVSGFLHFLQVIEEHGDHVRHGPWPFP